MACAVRLIAVLLTVIISLDEINCEDSAQTDVGDDSSASIPVLPLGKRQHNIMRFGKRPAGGHSLIHFGKREEGPPAKPPSHSFLYFGKRSESDGQTLPDLIKYLQKNRDNSYKRGHTIMRFGKRAGGENHNFIRFGKRADADYDEDYYPVDYDEDQKRDGHSMLYFGKRGGDGHSMLYFGKRAGGHAILSFGKRDPDDKRAAHAMIHFGKRDEDDDVDKRGGSHSMIHFGKREPSVEDVSPLFWFPEPSQKRQHNLLRFGKKTDGYRKGSHSMIHFGKREDPESRKKTHAMIHFGKRSLDQNTDPDTKQSEEASSDGPPKTLIRMKRDIDPSGGPLMSLVQHDEEDDEGLQNIYGGNKDIYYPPEDIFSPFEVQEEQDAYSDYRYPVKKDGSKNVFLRFG